ncbi:hypothetical protein V8C86DRAFT_2802072 [Haematococcus lacustris]
MLLKSRLPALSCGEASRPHTGCISRVLQATRHWKGSALSKALNTSSSFYPPSLPSVALTSNVACLDHTSSGEPALCQYSLRQVLRNMRRAMHTGGLTHALDEVEAEGVGRHLGISISWRMRWRPSDGAFFEHVTGPELGFKWGYDGQPGSSCWEVDSSGVCRSLECDDHEALLMGTWLRTGCWLQPALTQRLDIELLDSSVSKSNPVPSSDVGREASSGSMAKPHADPGSRTGAGSSVLLSVRTRNGKLASLVRVCTRRWVVQSLQQPLCGDQEVWSYGSWQAWQPGTVFPVDMLHEAAAGGTHAYRATRCSLVPAGPSPSTHFQVPATPLLPSDTTFEPHASPQVPVWQAASGHLLVQPHINGTQAAGYMVLDTGASGFVITPEAAHDLGMERFGELFAASIAGKVPSHFVKARSWSLGPLTIHQPVMMTMGLEGLVRGGPPGGTVIGIVGYDIFRRAVLELPQLTFPSHVIPAPISLPDSQTEQAAHTTATATSPSLAQQQLPQAAPPPQGLDLPPGSHSLAPGPLYTPSAPQPSAAWPGQGRASAQDSSPLLHQQSHLRHQPEQQLQAQQGQPQAQSLSAQAAGQAGQQAGRQAAARRQVPGRPVEQMGFWQSLLGNHLRPGSADQHVDAKPTTTGASPAAQSPSPSSCSHDTSKQDMAAQSGLVTMTAAAAAVACPAVQHPLGPLFKPGPDPLQHPNMREQDTYPALASASPTEVLEQQQTQPQQSQGRSPSWPAGQPVGSALGSSTAGCRHLTMMLRNPEHYGGCAEADLPLVWHPMRMISSLPHLEVIFLGPSGQPLRALLMLDTGACGADIMLHARAVKELGLAALGRPSSAHSVRGVGGTSAGAQVRVDLIDLAWLDMAGLRFQQVKCMHAGVGGLDISLYSSGIICQDLIARLAIVIDYPRKRIGLRLPPASF